MFRLNNKGQTLVMFVLLLPVFLFVLVLIVDVANLAINKNKIDDVSRIVIEYGLDHLDEDNVLEKMKEYIELNNLETSELDISINDNKIYMNIKKENESIIGNVFSDNLIDFSYVGYIEEDSKIIERVK